MSGGFDDNIRRALGDDAGDGGRAAIIEEPMLRQVGDVFRGTRRWLVLVSVAMTLAFVGIGIFSGVRFFAATETRAMFSWAIVLIFCLLSIAMLKIWFWMQMDKYSVLREIKRLEVQVARLAERER